MSDTIGYIRGGTQFLYHKVVRNYRSRNSLPGALSFLLPLFLSISHSLFLSLFLSLSFFLFLFSRLSLFRKSPGILGLRDIFQYLLSVSVPGLALQALILHYINKGLKNQGCRGKQIDVVEASRYSANTRLPSLSIFLLHCVFHLRAKRYYTTGVESNIIFLHARAHSHVIEKYSAALR